jgi:hypothetical protein
MSEFQLKMTLDGVKSGDAQVRVWIDTELGGDLSCEQEIDLVRDDEEASWSGLFSAEGEAFIYRVGICATPGTAWSLSVRDASNDGGELLFDSDLLTMAKEWLIGSCEPSASESDEQGCKSGSDSGAFS